MKHTYSNIQEALNFNQIEFDDLLQIVDIEAAKDEKVFEKWFNFDYTLNESEEAFLQEILEDNFLLVDTYSEEELKAKVIVPILNKVRFKGKNV